MSAESSGGKRNTQRIVVISLLGAAHAVIGLIWMAFSATEPNFNSGCFFGLMLCQLTLLAAWAGLGRAFWPWRIALALIGCVYVTLVMSFGLGSGDFVHLFFLAGALVLIVATALGLLQRNWIELRCVEDGPGPRDAEMQVSIRQLLLLTFLVAGLAAGSRFIDFKFGEFNVNMAFTLTLLGVCFMAPPLPAIYATLSEPFHARRLLAIVGVAFLAGVLAALACDGGFHRIHLWWYVTGAQSMFLTASLFAVRIAGYRVVAKT